MNDNVAVVIGEHVRVGTVLETYLERVPTLLGDADDQHLVIMAQRLRVVGNRAPLQGEVVSKGAPLRGPTAAAGCLARCANSLNENVASDAAVDVALDGRADLGDQIVCLAIH